MFKSCVTAAIAVFTLLAGPAMAAEGQPIVIKFAHVVADDTPKGKGALLQTESELSDASGTLLYRMQAASFAVGAKGFKGAGVSHSRPSEPRYGQRTRRPGRGRAGAPTARGDLTPAHGCTAALWATGQSAAARAA